jgi:hypothetical protein
MPEPWIQTQVTSCETHSGLNSTLGGLSPSFLAFPPANDHSTAESYSSVLSHEMRDSPDQATHNHVLGVSVGRFISDPGLGFSPFVY